MYHLGKFAGITEKSFKAKNAAQREIWWCPPCHNGGSASAQSNSLKGSDMKAILASISEKLPLLTEKVGKRLMEQSLRFMSNKFDDFEKQSVAKTTNLKNYERRWQNWRKRRLLAKPHTVS